MSRDTGEQPPVSGEQHGAEALLRIATEIAGIGIWKIDIATREVTWTRGMNAIYGLPSKADASYDEVRALAHPDDRARVEAAFARAVAGEAGYDLTYRVLRGDGEIGWLEVRGQLVRDARGEATHIVGTSRDVTAQQRAAARLELSEHSLRLATDAGGVGTWDFDLTTDTLTWPDRTKAMFGISPDQPCSMADFYAGLHPDDRDATAAAFAASIDPARRTIYDVEYRTIGKEDGIVRWVAAKGKGLFAGDACVRAIGTAIDITARKQAEARQLFLLRLLDEMRRLIDPREIMRIAMLSLDPELGVDRVGYGRVSSDETMIRLDTDYLRNAEPLDGEYALDSFGPELIAVNRANRTVAVPDVYTDERLPQDVWAAIGVRSFASVPLVRDGRLRASLFVMRNAPSEWPADDVALLQAVAERTWDAVERARAEAERTASEARLRAVVQAAPIGLIFADAPDGRITGGNATVEQILRHPVLPSPDVAHYREWTGFHLGGRRIEGHEYPLARALGGEERPELEALYRRGDGTDAYLRFIAAPVRGPDGAIVGGVVASLDIDLERRAAMRQALLVALADRLLSLTEPRAIVAATAQVLGQHLRASRAGFGEIGADGTEVTYATGWVDGVANLRGTHRLDTLGRGCAADLRRGLTTVFDDVLIDPRTAELDHALVETRSAVVVPLVRDGGLRAIFYVAFAQVHAWSADEVSLMEEVAARTWDALERARAEASLRDLNATLEARVEERTAELLRAEDALRQAQKMEAVGQLTGGIAHDFNNMLAVVLGSLELLGRRLPEDDARARRYVDAANEGARRATNLTQRLLAFSRRQPLQPEPLNVNRLVAGMSDLLRHSLVGQVRLETVLAGGLWSVNADPNQLENVILNLGINARDAMPEGGRVTIETQNAHLDDRYAANEPGMIAGHYVMIAVTDEGTGMDVDVIAKAFDPFFTTKGVGKGTGLGLSQVYGFVKQSGGHVKIYSEVGHGTTVKIYLPRLVGGIAATPAPAGKDDLPRGEASELVLVVEDDPAVRAFTVEALGELGYPVLHVDGAAAALAAIEAHPGIALLLTDIVMPDVDGAKLAEAARARRPALKVLFMTGYTRNAVVHNGVVDPGVELIGKPFTIAELAAKMRSVLDKAVRAER